MFFGFVFIFLTLLSDTTSETARCLKGKPKSVYKWLVNEKDLKKSFNSETNKRFLLN